ncbi:MAG: aminoacyl-tRNA hydrolase [Cryobacterium sp.]|nr:aminoacyl-tRNA hydrolase [Oligoflexia bacterium]
MKIIVGLGNPGSKYETTRHNVGWLALDRMIDDWKAVGPKTQNQAEVWTANLGGEKVLLLKPQTFMNLSGRAVAPIVQFYKASPEDLIVIHDELDIPPNTLKLKTGGGNGGHNGLKSIDECLGLNNYHRVRIGIGHPRDYRPQMDVADWVLAHYSPSECADLDEVFTRTRDAVRMLVAGDMKRAANSFNQKISNPKTAVAGEKE